MRRLLPVFVIAGVILLLGAIAPQPASAHPVRCCRNWDEFAAHCRAQGGTPKPNPARCEEADGSSATPMWTIVGATPGRAFVTGSAYGAGIGALGGSLFYDADSGSQAGPWALIGAGIVLAYGDIKNRQWPALGAVTIAAIAGGAEGAGFGMLADGKYKKGSAEDLATPDKTASYAVTGAAVGAGLEIFARLTRLASSKLTRDALPGTNGLPARRSSIGLLQRGNRLGINVKW